ncbi:MAG TPA: MBL fold metallo-hydrolase [Streptosporangiaceae bacterium]|nr:MBL fold metallo-hydrolase [Streptosporangiaceae bacterium]
MHEVVTIATPGLGDRSYLVHDGSSGVVVDAQRDIGRFLGAADAAGVRITHVVETHIHNDYVTGGYALAKEAGAAYVVAASEDVGFERVQARDHETFGAGSLGVTPVHTPGHTLGHLSYVLAEGSGEPFAVFTGGSMLFGAVGRTDLIAPELTDQLTRAQYRSVRRLADELPDQVAVYPTHGFGSFCSATQTSGEQSTIGHERHSNVALRGGDEDTFVKELLAGLSAYPSYYAHMAAANRGGPPAADLTRPRPASPAELRRRIEAGEWVVDLRSRRAFADLHVAGTVSVELGEPFATYLGWVLPWGAPLTLIGDSPDQVADAQLQLARIGVEPLAAAATGPVTELAAGRTGSYPVTGFPGLAEAWGRAGMVVLDVRRPDEWQAGHLPGALHIPFWELAGRAGEVPAGQVWVHCASGFRASIGASVLARAGRDVIHVDDDWSSAAGSGLPVTDPEPA